VSSWGFRGGFSHREAIAVASKSAARARAAAPMRSRKASSVASKRILATKAASS
jgi:hypothetical protein